MRCRNCDYSLWNLTARECPECGQSFRPSEFDFVAGSVQFACPHCRQVYYGTAENGHLQPIEFDCVSCGSHVHMDEMVLRPAVGLEDRDTTVDDVPWLERKHIGFVKGWFGTVWKSIVAPHRLMTAMPHHGATGQAWSFMLLTVILSTLVTFGSYVLLFGVMGVFLAGPGGMFGMIVPLIIAGYWIGYVIITVLFVALWGVTTHGILRLTGSTLDSIGRTYSALCFASGPFVLMAVPCFGMYIAMPWWVVAAVLMVYTAQKVSGWRAAISVVTLPLVSWLLVVGAYFGILAFAFPAMQGGFAPVRVAAQTTGVQSSIIQHAAWNQGEGPLHIAEAFRTTGLSVDLFVVPGSFTQMTATPIGDTDLYTLSQADLDEFRRIVALTVSAMPEDVIAHRLGDYVFTYHGIDLLAPDPELWLFIICADPDQNSSADIDGRFYVGTIGWAGEPVPADEFDKELELQNRLREGLGLPAIPHPWQVRHGRPAVVSGTENGE